MQISRLEIEQEQAKIEVSSQLARIQVQSQNRAVQINMEPGELSVDYMPGEVDLDQTSLQENTARRDVFALQKHYAAVAAQKAQQGIAQTAQDGDFMAQPGQGAEYLAGQLAQMHMLNTPTPTYGRSSVPSDAVSMDGKGGSCEIEWTPQEVEIQWDRYSRPTVSLEPPPSVEVELVQRPEVNCTLLQEETAVPPGTAIDIDG